MRDRKPKSRSRNETSITGRWDLRGDPDFRQRFEREARAISGNIMLTKSEAKLLDFEHGTEVSPEVKLAMEEMVRQIAAE
jgi:hypothetical protein